MNRSLIIRAIMILGVACLVVSASQAGSSGRRIGSQLSDRQLALVRGAEGSNVEDEDYSCEDANAVGNQVSQCTIATVNASCIRCGTPRPHQVKMGDETVSTGGYNPVGNPWGCGTKEQGKCQPHAGGTTAYCGDMIYDFQICQNTLQQTIFQSDGPGGGGGPGGN